jgi:hypothetical protein
MPSRSRHQPSLWAEGSWSVPTPRVLGDVRPGQGRENAKQFLRDNPETADEITAHILAARGAGPPVGSNGAAEDGEGEV